MGIYQSPGIREIWIPETLIILFLVAPLLRPFIKALWPLEGLIWLPLVAMGIAVGIFPAYGFRPECIPMVVFIVIFNIINLPSLVNSVVSHTDNSFRKRGFFFSVFALALLGVVTVPMFAFSPKSQIKPDEGAELAAGPSIKITGAGKPDYFLRVYGEIHPNRPLIFIVPPESGSAVSVDLVCIELQRKGYTVITYFRDGYDTTLIDEHGRKRGSLVKRLAYQRISRRATTHVSANEQGKALEAERRADIEFLLPRIPALSNGMISNDNLPPFLLVGYGAGGSALAYLAGESGFLSRHSNILGIVAIESRLWSAYLPEQRSVAEIPASAGIVRRHWMGIVHYFQNMKPQRVSHTGPLPGTGIPLLHLVSGAALDSQKGQKTYQAVLNSTRSSSGPIALAAIKSAGPLDYQDYPFTRPIYSSLFPGLKSDKKSKTPISDTASVIGNFASLLLDRTKRNTTVSIPHPQAVNGSFYVESKGLPNTHYLYSSN